MNLSGTLRVSVLPCCSDVAEMWTSEFFGLFSFIAFSFCCYFISRMIHQTLAHKAEINFLCSPLTFSHHSCVNYLVLVFSFMSHNDFAYLVPLQKYKLTQK